MMKELIGKLFKDKCIHDYKIIALYPITVNNRKEQMVKVTKCSKCGEEKRELI